MKKLTTVLYTIIGLTALCSWGNHSENPIKKTEWLLGNWEHKTQNGSIYETWSKISDHEFAAKTYFLKEKDTTVFETIQLIQEKDNLLFIPTVKNQNNGLPVRFTLKKITDTEMVFENPQHDFPQIISYTQISPDSLVAEVSGIKSGQELRQTFPMKRFSNRTAIIFTTLSMGLLIFK